MASRGYSNTSSNFSVTSSRDGSRSFNGNHNDRWRRSHGGRGPKNRGHRGNQRGGFRHFNSNSSRYRNRPGNDADGDISMSGDSYNHRSRDRYRGRGGRGSSRVKGGRYRPTVNLQECWFKVLVPFGTCMTREQLFDLIRSGLEGISFNPVSYHTIEKRAFFYVKGTEEGESLRALSRRLTKPDNHKLILHVSESGPPPRSALISDEEKEKLKLVMSSRYDPSTRLLNLSSLHTDASLCQDGIVLYLNKSAVMDAVTSIIIDFIPELCGLDLSCNKMLSLGHMVGLVKGAVGVTSLNLAKNQIRSVEELEKLKGWSNIGELVLEGNDLCNNFKNQTEYVRCAVRKKMPKVVKLDGNDLPPPVSFSLDTIPLPTSKGSFFLEEKWKNLIVTFVKEYYSIYDSDSRKNLMAAYSENAQFSYCFSRNSTIEKQGGFKVYTRDSRNLKRIGYLNSDEKAKRIKAGTLAVISTLESLPKTTHDMNSFTVDVTLATPAAMVFVLHGVFKETENQSDTPIIRSFSRTFVTVPSGEGICIINDMLTISNAGLEQSRNAFKGGAPTPSSSPASSSQTDGTDKAQGQTLTEQQKKMVESFAADSGMNMQFSLNCLQENAWNYQQAGQIFMDLKSQGKIPPEAFIKS